MVDIDSRAICSFAIFYYILSYGPAITLPLAYQATSTTTLGRFFSSVLCSPVLNYYSDSSSVILTSSKTMALCSHLNLKKNFSFASVCY